MIWSARWKLWYVRSIVVTSNRTIDVVRYLLFNKPISPTRILIFRTGSIGDNICAMRAMVCIRKAFPSANLDILTNAGAADLVSIKKLLSPEYYHRILDYSDIPRNELLAQIRRERYDLVIELTQDQSRFSGNIRNMVFFKLAGIRSGFGWEVTTCFMFRQTQERYLTFRSERERLTSMLVKNGIPCNESLFPLHLRAEDHNNLHAILSRHLVGDDRLVAVVPGAKRPQNRYPLDRFKVIVEWILARGYKVVIIGGPDDQERGNALASDPGAFSVCGLLTPIQSAAILSRCFLCISNDTGPMHLSYAVGTPVIGLFSSRDFPGKWFPPEGNIALRNDNVHCSLCFSETCADNICMQGIPVAAIKNAFLLMENTKTKLQAR